MRSTIHISTLQAAGLMVAMMLLSSCAPTPAITPSVALKDELLQIRQQQQAQAEQLQILTRQITLLQQAFGIDKIKTAETDPLEALIFATTEEAQRTPREPQRIEMGPDVAAYLAAFSGLASGRPEAAEERFERFLKEYPGHQQTPNARFWLAHAQQSQGKTDLATSNLRRIIVDPQARHKAPAAMMQLSIIYRQQGLTRQADDIIEQLRNSYPESHEAQQLLRSDSSPQ